MQNFPRFIKVCGTFSLAVLLLSSLAPPSSAATKSKQPAQAGRTLPATINTVLSGNGTPASSLGKDGDFYIDVRNSLFFGPKTKGRWPLPVSLVGPSGPVGSTGAPGKAGVKGEDGAPGVNVTGSAGAQGPVGPAGPTGPQGPAGTPGAQGPVGATGATGATGPQGPSGGGGVGERELLVRKDPQVLKGSRVKPEQREPLVRQVRQDSKVKLEQQARREPQARRAYKVQLVLHLLVE